MEKLRLTLAITMCKLLIMISRFLGKKGSSVPGQIALKICPGVLSHLSKTYFNHSLVPFLDDLRHIL